MSRTRNLLALMGLVAAMPSGIEETQPPPWAGARTKPRGGSRRKHLERVPDIMRRTSYYDKNTRDIRARDLRAEGKKNVTKYSSSANGKSLWYVAWSE